MSHKLSVVNQKAPDQSSGDRSVSKARQQRPPLIVVSSHGTGDACCATGGFRTAAPDRASVLDVSSPASADHSPLPHAGIHPSRLLQESQNRYSQSAKDWGWREFITLTSLFDQDAGFLVNDSVLFSAEVLVLKESSEARGRGVRAWALGTLEG